MNEIQQVETVCLSGQDQDVSAKSSLNTILSCAFHQVFVVHIDQPLMSQIPLFCGPFVDFAASLVDFCSSDVGTLCGFCDVSF
jgi:hypothetical protein